MSGYKFQAGEKNPNWHGGRNVTERGHVLILLKSHPRSNHRGYIREHIVIAEKAIGHTLPKNCQIHHWPSVRGCKTLVICQDDAYHKYLHQRQRAFMACGNANWRKCSICKQYDAPENLKKHGRSIYHRICLNTHRRLLYTSRKAKNRLSL